ncbi:hypothetical protein EVAR_2407_1 [Eumeta japonica]|uniref:Uncharacterized protein n=1 Tax=Eumeta variegata TaxID=151549 RepID=A0A4C1SN59_EUMVA|nr:hypothetical protein EVAR_2407_1 [Eumeta japonica]
MKTQASDKQDDDRVTSSEKASGPHVNSCKESRLELSSTPSDKPHLQSSIVNVLTTPFEATPTKGDVIDFSASLAGRLAVVQIGDGGSLPLYKHCGPLCQALSIRLHAARSTV